MEFERWMEMAVCEGILRVHWNSKETGRGRFFSRKIYNELSKDGR
jgi:capsid protein